MGVYVALLRGINIRQNNRIAMADLRELVGSLGHENVRTHILSGNVVFSSKKRSAKAIAAELEKAIDKRFGLKVAVIVRTQDELAKVIEANPFRDGTRYGSRYYAIFLSENPTKERVRAIDAAAFEPEKVAFGERVIYAWYVRGLQASKLAGELSDRKLGVTTTARNWNTVTKLLEIAEDT
jgi:uncharacterized protein (DUF1697 family)